MQTRPQTKSQKNTDLFLFNVGIGDSSLLRFSNGHFGIFDLHYQRYLAQSEPPILSYFRYLLKEKKVKQIVISFLCLSHYDADHIKGLSQFLEYVEKSNGKISIENIWLAGAKGRENLREILLTKLENIKDELSSEEYDKFIPRIEKYDERFKTIEDFVDTKWASNKKPVYTNNFSPINGNVGDGFEANSLAPLPHHIEEYHKKNARYIFERIFLEKDPNKVRTSEPAADRNLISSIIYLKNDLYQLMFGGDASTEVWIDVLKEFDNRTLDRNLFSNFVKVSHHGSKNSSEVEIFEALMQKKGITYLGISAGTMYNHPHPKTLKDIKDAATSTECDASIFATNNPENSASENKDMPQFQKWNLDEVKTYLDKNNEIALSLENDSEFFNTSTEKRRTPNLLAYQFSFNQVQKEVKVFALPN